MPPADEIQSMRFNKEAFRKRLKHWLEYHGIHHINTASSQQIYRSISHAIMDQLQPLWRSSQKILQTSTVKRTCYLSAEFLPGRALGNNLINLGIRQEVSDTLEEFHIDINAAEESEAEPSLGNGGMGRLATCIIESAATLNLPVRGYGIRYKYGMFRQEIIDCRQVEKPDEWNTHLDPWSIRREESACIVSFGGDAQNQTPPEKIRAIPYDMPVIGWKGQYVNTIRLWEAEATEPFNLEQFNKNQYQQAFKQQNRAQSISHVLYPSDNTEEGRTLRLRQQYFFCSASIQDSLREFKTIPGTTLSQLPETYVFQLNDTHPVIAIPELIRILLDEESMNWNESFRIAGKVFAYTNHSILSEALECWPVELWHCELPRILQIVEQIDQQLESEMAGTNNTRRIIENNSINMGHLAVFVSFSINGVAAIHTEILKKRVFKDWYQIHPARFNNKTNGVTQRRWLKKANPALATFLDESIGPQWISNLALLTQLSRQSENTPFLSRIGEIKNENKRRLATTIHKNLGITLNPRSLFDLHIKRLHEYKRQLLNILSVIADWQALMDGEDHHQRQRSIIFAAKAAMSYRRAKQIIHLINRVAKRINQSPAAESLKVVFMPNYGISIAEELFPAAEVSQQISFVGQEASGTGNMKFMMNGAITLGTMDGTNIDIFQEVGRENAFIFGITAEQATRIQQEKQYNPISVAKENPILERALNSLIDGTFTPGDEFREIHQSLLHGINGCPADPYFVLQDFASYHKTRRNVTAASRETEHWNRMALFNIAASGIFSSDRTVWEYATYIWELEAQKIPVW